MNKKQNQSCRKTNIIIFACVAIAFFVAVAFRFRLAEFQLSMLTLMLLLLSMFTLAVILMYWKIIHPISQKISKKGLKKIFQ